MNSSPHILMCPPDHFGIEYEINPWMDRQRCSDHRLAVQQWSQLRAVLEAAGARISLVEPRPGLPDLVFTANAALISDDLAILSRFRHPERKREEPVFEQWFAEHGFQVHRLQVPADFEGAGDALFCGSTLLAGYRIRSDIAAYREIASLLDCRVVPLELVDPRFYHLDTCFCPLASGMAMYFPDAFDRYGRRALEAAIADLIPVVPEEAELFACNAAVVGQSVITPEGCPQLHQQLEARGFRPQSVELSEFIKAGGAAKCLTLRLDGEQARTRTQVGNSAAARADRPPAGTPPRAPIS